MKSSLTVTLTSTCNKNIQTLPTLTTLQLTEAAVGSKFASTETTQNSTVWEDKTLHSRISYSCNYHYQFVMACK